MTRSFLTLGVGAGLLLGFAGSADAQQALPPVRPLGSLEHVSSATFRAVSGVRELPDRRVLVNDIVDHRVLLFDSTLTTATAIADSTPGTGSAYGNMPGGLIRYRGDSTLFVDPASMSMLVLDGSGKVARVLAVPRPTEAMFLIGGPFGEPGMDPEGRLVYRGSERLQGVPKGVDLKTYVPQFPDSAPIVRMNLANRAEDTVAFFKLPPTKMAITRTENGFSASSIVNPMPIVDTWALLPDGTIAVVRGRDFHVDWYRPDGTHASSAKIPFDWQRLTDSLKTFVLDSAKQAMEKQREQRMAALDSTRKLTGGRGATESAVTAGRGMADGGAPQIVMMVRTGGGGDGGAAPPMRGGPGAKITLPPLQMVQPYELPDYRPAFTVGATKSDASGNLWIRTTDANDGRPVYDVVNDKGTLIDRVQLPPFRTIVGFGRGVVYMAVVDVTGVVRLERARISAN
ncbi:MAG TPA: hypothetical protein VHB25_20765 [Gemmatimonadaceae bacterium]|nr:hypothetical protein [Gemmatimonadaceae bacterium]